MLQKDEKIGKIKYLLLSFIIHASLLVGLTLGSENKVEKKSNKQGQNGRADSFGTILPKVVDIDLVDAPIKLQKKVNIARPKPAKEKIRPKRGDFGYWGIGIYVSYQIPPVYYNGIYYPASKITNVIPGNPAWINGLQSGDLIFMVNGNTLDREDIRGSEKGKLRLGIKRGRSILFITIERDWIETSKRKDS